MRGYQNPSLHSGNVTDQRGIAPRVTLGRPPTLTEKWGVKYKNWGRTGAIQS